MDENLQLQYLVVTSDIVRSYIGNNHIQVDMLPDLISSVHNTVANLGKPVMPAVVRGEPAVPVKKSVTDEFIICLEDGKKFKSLKRHIMTRYGLSPDQYRAKWDLPADYPMVCKAYSEQRTALAKASGLGRKR